MSIEEPKSQIELSASADRALDDAELDIVSGGTTILTNATHTSIATVVAALETMARKQ
jgi:hypothetical protein